MAYRLIDLDRYRRQLAERRRDETLDAEWDALTAAAAEAWCWRDPESIMALEALVKRLRERVLEDWEEALRRR